MPDPAIRVIRRIVVLLVLSGPSSAMSRVAATSRSVPGMQATLLSSRPGRAPYSVATPGSAGAEGDFSL